MVMASRRPRSILREHLSSVARRSQRERSRRQCGSLHQMAS